MKKNKLGRVLWYVFASSALIAIIMQTIAVLTAYDPTANYFSLSSPLPTLAWIFAILAAIIGTAASALTDKDALNTKPFSEKACLTPATIGLLIAALLMAIYARITVYYSWIGTVTVGMLLLAALYSFLISLPKFRVNRTVALTFLGFFAVLSCIFFTAYFYFDTSIEMNAPFKTTVQLGLLCAMLYYTGELRYLLGTARSRVFLMICSWLVSFSSLSAIPISIAYCLDKFKRVDYTAGALLIFCITLTAISRMRMLLSGPKTAIPKKHSHTDSDVEQDGKDAQ